MLARPLLRTRRAMSQLSELVPIGRFSEAQPETKPYKPGQFFLHSSLGYRGVVVMPWEATVFEYPSSTPSEDDAGRKRMTPVSEAVPVNRTYYQVLTDEEDSRQHKRIGLGTQTWTPHQGVVLNLDLVSHDNLMPYTPTQPSTASTTSTGGSSGNSPSSLLEHPLMDTLFNTERTSEVKVDIEKAPAASAGVGATPHTRGGDSSSTHSGGGLGVGELMAARPDKPHQRWVRMMEPAFSRRRCYECCSHDIRVTIIPFYDCATHYDNSDTVSHHKAFSWYYKAVVHYHGNGAVQLMSKWWQTIDANGQRDFIRGRGILRQFPVLTPAEPSFQFTGHISLATDHGIMGGSLTFVPVVPCTEPRKPSLVVEMPTFELEREELAGSSVTQLY